MTILTLSDLTTPFEIDIADTTYRALPDFAEKIGLTLAFGDTLAGAIRSFNSKLAKLAKPGTNWQRWAIAGAGVAVIAIAPIGLIALAPAGVAGAAAMTGGLAALGPGGMAGGIATIGGIAGTGAAITTAATVAGRRGDHSLSSEELLLAVAVAYAQKSLGHEFDQELWQKASDAAAEASALINTLEAISDSKAPSLTAMIAERDLTQNLVQFMDSNDMTPESVPDLALT